MYLKAVKRADGHWYIEDGRGVALFVATGERNEHEIRAKEIEQNAALRHVLVRLLDALDDAQYQPDPLGAMTRAQYVAHEGCREAGLQR